MEQEPTNEQTNAQNIPQEVEIKAESQQKPKPVVDLDDRPIGGSKPVGNDQVPIGGASKPFGNDQMPIGGGSRQVFSQYPDENAPIQPKKPVVKKAPLKAKKQEQKHSQETSQPAKPKKQTNLDEIPINTNSIDDKPLGGGMKSQFDQKPIGKSNFNISQFPEDGPPPETSAPVLLPLQQRIKSKAIKTKMAAFQQLTGLIQSGDTSVADSVEFNVALKESNPGCLQKILICFQKYVQKDGRWSDEQIKALIDSGYINGKGISKKIAWQIVDLLYQKKPQTVQAGILGGLKGKTMKTVAGFITVINQLLAVYGIKKMNLLKPYYPDVIKLISNQKLPLLKTEGTTMLKEAAKWLTKDFLDPIFKTHSLKDTIKKQIDQFWDEYDKNAVMTAPKADAQAPKKGGGKAAKVDVYNLSQAVDVFKKYNQKWVSDLLKTEKWSEKVKLMNDFINAASVPKIANTEFRHIIDLIKRLIGDANMNVVLNTLKIAAVMAQGLRKHFFPYAKMFFGDIIEKFKDKKTQMIDETNKCLNDFSYCISIQDVLDDIKQGLNDKNPNMKVNIMIWIERVIDRKAAENGGEVPAKLRDSIKGLFAILEKLCNDGAVNVRQITVKVIAKARAYIGNDFFGPLQVKLGKVIVGKIDAVIVDIPERPATAQQKQKQQPINLSQTMRPQTSGVSNPLSKTMNLEVNDRSSQKQIPQQKTQVSSRFQKSKPEKSLPKAVQKSTQKVVQVQQQSRTGVYNGDTIMPDTRILESYKLSRKQIQNSSPWNYQSISLAKQDQLIAEIGKSFRKDLSSRMLAINYKKVHEAAAQIIKLCKDTSHHDSLRQVSDVILKWILYRLFGGNPPLSQYLMQVTAQVLVLSERNNRSISQNQIFLVISILRQFSISGVDLNFKLPDCVNTSINTLVKLFSGDKVLKALLRQYQVDLNNVHKHLKRDSTLIYRQCLNRVIKQNLIDFVGTQQILKTTSQIRQLARDPEFVDMLYSKYRDDVLNPYGFSRQTVMRTPHRQAQHSPNTSALHNSQHHSTSQTKPNNSGLLQPPPLHPQQQGLRTPIIANKSGINSSSGHITASNTLPSNISSSNLYATRGGSQSNLAPQIQQRVMTPPISQHNYIQQQIPLISKINLGSYPCPHLSNPLNEHLSKLNPPNDTTLQFFQALFTQTSQRIASQLQDYAKIILGAILKSNIDMIDRRNDIPPEKLAAQLNLLMQALKNKNLIRNSGEVLSFCTEFVLKQLVYQDENKIAIGQSMRDRGYDYKVQNFIKIINGVMLRILQNGHPHQVIITLIDFLITTMKKPVYSQKTLSLVLKCMGRVINSYVGQIQQANLKELFLKIHQYNIQFEGRLKPDDQGLESMRKLLTQIAKQISDNVWRSYEKAMQQTNVPDQFIANHFQNLKVPYTKKPKYSQKQEQLKKISQMLSKIRTYESGMRLLNSFLEQYPDFPIAKYFADLNYEPRFIQKVMQALDTNYNRQIQPKLQQSRRSQQRRQRSIERSSDNIDIQHRIKNLRQRYDRMQVKQEQSRQEEQVSSPQPATSQSQHREDDADPDRANQIKRRIIEMKARIHNVIR